VYNYTGAFVRTIGGPGVTNYPIGVGVDRIGHVIVADNHNNFNVTVFDCDGMLIRALESRVKHAHCYDMALTGDGDIVVSSKDFRVYVYRYEAPVTMPSLAVGFPYM
jgi:tripartite motif-containing protein 2/3